MSQTSLAALVRARFAAPFWSPEFVAEVLEACWPPCAGATRGWSVGCVLGNETLVQSRPMIRSADGRFVEDFLRTPAPATLAAYVCDRDESGPPAPLVHRLGRWIGAAIPTEPLPGDLAETWPDFVRRERRTGKGDEALFLTFVAALHGAGGLRAAYAADEQIERALAAVRETAGAGHDLLLHDGRTLVLVNGRGRLAVFRAPDDPQRRRRPDDPPQAALFTTCDEPFESAARSGAERIAQGAFLVRPSDPLALRRLG